MSADYFVIPSKYILFCFVLWTVGIPSTSGSSSGLRWQGRDHRPLLWGVRGSPNCHSAWCQRMSVSAIALFDSYIVTPWRNIQYVNIQHVNHDFWHDKTSLLVCSPPVWFVSMARWEIPSSLRILRARLKNLKSKRRSEDQDVNVDLLRKNSLLLRQN